MGLNGASALPILPPPSVARGGAPTLEGEHKRRYRILSKLADGGYGSVYHGRIEAHGGFTKDVAIKLLHEHLANEGTLKRFRAEARMLALIRDAAVVRVDPPVLLDGRWALVMELVDGASLATLLKQHGRLPPGVAIEVVERIARTLDNIWRQQGPDGQPLKMLHRDIKPGNIQITPDGSVRLLDLGIARAESIADEISGNTFLGTPGYMAPERLTGEDGPTSDIFSLGVVLHELVLGKRPPVVTDTVGYVEKLQVDAATRRVLHLAARMFDLEADHRPGAREVERKAQEIRLVTSAPYLRDWVEDHVPHGYAGVDDALSGRVLVEDPDAGLLDAASTDGSADPHRSPLVMGAVWLGVAALLLTVGLGALTILAVQRWVGADAPATPDPAPDPIAQTQEAPPPPPPEPQTEPAPEPQPAVEPAPVVPPAPVQSAPRPTPRPKPQPKAATTLEDLRVRALPNEATITIVMSDAAVKPLHYLVEDASPEVPAQYVVSFRGGANGLPEGTWAIDRPVPGRVQVSERSGTLVIAVQASQPARLAFSGTGPTWTVSLKPR